MRVVMFLAAMLLWVQPARAAVVWNLSFYAAATGQITQSATQQAVCAPTHVVCPDIVTPASQAFSGLLNVPAFIGSYNFNQPTGAREGYSGTIDFDGLNLTGRNFVFLDQGGPCIPSNSPGGYCTYTRLAAATFTVLVVGNGPVPEPATWVMMLIGFALIGAARRRRKIPTAVTYA